MVLAALGEKGLEEYIDQQHDLTLEAYDYLQSQDDFNCPVKPQSNILVFQVREMDDEHLDLRDMVHARGNFYISSTIFKNQRCLRLTLTNPATSIDVIKRLVQEIRELMVSN